jgi:hypothetical protein
MPSPAPRFLRFLYFGLLGLLAWGAAACSPDIGDHCALNTDCSINGTRQCDTALPGGYCTMFNCGPNSCPNGSGCYLFYAEVQGCPYDDRQPSRTAHSFCIKDCAQNSDCRTGYECADLRLPPWNALLLDDNQDQPGCIPIPDTAENVAGDLASFPDGAPPVCQADPDMDAAFSPYDAAVPVLSFPSDDGGADAGVTEDAEADSDARPSPDAGDAGAPAMDGGDAAADATLDGGLDATMNDSGAAPDGADTGTGD